MDPVLPDQSPDNQDVKPSFRKPSNDAANRKYRRRSPVGGRDASSPDGSPKREWSRSPVRAVEDRNTMYDDRRKKKDVKERELEPSRYLSKRASDTNRHTERPMHENSHDHHRRLDYNRYDRHADKEEMAYHRSSRSGRELSDTRYDGTRSDYNSDRTRDNRKDVDKYYRDGFGGSGHRSRDKEREGSDAGHHRFNDKDSEKSLSGKRQINSNRDIKTGERERHGGRGSRDDRRDKHRSPDYKNDCLPSQDPIKRRDRINDKERDGQKDDWVPKRKHDARETEKGQEKHGRDAGEMRNKSSSMSTYYERDGKNERFADKTISSVGIQDLSEKKLKIGHSEVDEKPSFKHTKDIPEIVTTKPTNSISDLGAENGHDAAKVAAMKAAELVNRNLVGGNYMSTDQKKKLLWGNKKSNIAEESANHWDVNLISDRERQEKFKKLMGVKEEEIKTDERDGTLRAEKQRELNMDLEKQYTAGLRRRDGRTVGLGL